MKKDELELAELDAAVAKALGMAYVEVRDGRCWAGVNHQDQDGGWFSPSSNWAQGGPIIDRGITTVYEGSHINGRWQAKFIASDRASIVQAWGPTALIAAMRVLVATRLSCAPSTTPET